ncbi:hypothetical protein BD779DRAFT_1613361 [Infundibulicybe gibba]|nr:hypothetical protein BD779DRAFT_1613361 [Infundibulicybe gibba]
MVYSCRACGIAVSRRYVKLHLQRSADPRCRAYLDELNKELQDPEAETPSRESSPHPCHADSEPFGPDSEGIPVLQTGDFFGDYRDEDFEMEDVERGGDMEMDLDEVEEQFELDLGEESEPGMEAPDDESDVDEDEFLDEQAADAAEAERGPEINRSIPNLPDLVDIDTEDPPQYDETHGQQSAGQRHEAEKNLSNSHSLSTTRNPYSPFTSKIDWEIAQWAKFRGPSSTAFTELMAIDGLVDKLGLSFKNSKELNRIIDKGLPERPAFERHSIEVGGEIFDVYFRDIMACIKGLYSDPDFAPYLIHAPERHYVDESQQMRMYHDMNTGEWWWSTQASLDRDTGPGGTIIPIILSTDKTQLTLFRNKSAYPLYMTIGNIPKEIRRRPSSRAYVLVGYLPTSRLSHIKNLASRRRCLVNLYHASGQVGVQMASGDGLVRRCHPLHACFIGDYPEQVLVACVTTGDCVQCPVSHDDLDDITEPEGLRPMQALLNALYMYDDDPGPLYEHCKMGRLKPVLEPFWKNLPYVHIYRSITPDVLHQLYQGEVCRRLPPNHNIRLFFQGITSFQICAFLLALVIDIPLPNRVSNRPLLASLRGILDFLYFARYPIHTNETLDEMEKSLQRFHDNKHIFVTLGVRTNFNITKLHFARHYARAIKLYGTTDNFNTEYTERLHIDLAKDAYSATNRKNEFSQMTLWLVRKEKMARHNKYIQWRLDGCPAPPIRIRTAPIDLHFRAALARFIVLTNHGNQHLTRGQLEDQAYHLLIPFQHVPVWHNIKFLRKDPLTGKTTTADIIHVAPARRDLQNRYIPPRFDTVLVNGGRGGQEAGIKAYQVAQVRVVFSIPKNMLNRLFESGVIVPKHLVYVEWFTAFPTSPDPYHQLFKISRCFLPDGSYLASIIPLANIFRSVHLFPKFGHAAPVQWASSNVLYECKDFYVNSHTDPHLYRVIY